MLLPAAALAALWRHPLLLPATTPCSSFLATSNSNSSTGATSTTKASAGHEHDARGALPARVNSSSMTRVPRERSSLPRSPSPVVLDGDAPGGPGRTRPSRWTSGAVPTMASEDRAGHGELGAEACGLPAMPTRRQAGSRDAAVLLHGRQVEPPSRRSGFLLLADAHVASQESLLELRAYAAQASLSLPVRADDVQARARACRTTATAATRRRIHYLPGSCSCACAARAAAACLPC